MSEPLRIVTFFWNDPGAKHHGNYEFTPEHVNKLMRGFRKHLTLDHEFICITDNPDGIDVTNVRVIPLWNEFRDLGRCFTRLGVFSEGMREIVGPRFACIDLDVVLVGNVDHIFGRTEPFIGYRDSKNPRCFSGCFYMMNAGAKEQVYKSFRRLYNMIPPNGRREWFLQNYNKFSDLVGSDQSWQSEIIGNPDAPDAPPRFGQDQGIYDFWNIEDLPELPENSRIIFCNGMRRDPSMKTIQEKYPFVKEHWVDI